MKRNFGITILVTLFISNMVWIGSSGAQTVHQQCSPH